MPKHWDNLENGRERHTHKKNDKKKHSINNNNLQQQQITEKPDSFKRFDLVELTAIRSVYMLSTGCLCAKPKFIQQKMKKIKRWTLRRSDEGERETEKE